MTTPMSEIEGRLLSRQVLRTEQAKAVLATRPPRWPRVLIFGICWGALSAFGGDIQKALDVNPGVLLLFTFPFIAVALAAYEIVVLHRRVAALTELLLDR